MRNYPKRPWNASHGNAAFSRYSTLLKLVLGAATLIICFTFGIVLGSWLSLSGGERIPSSPLLPHSDSAQSRTRSSLDPDFVQEKLREPLTTAPTVTELPTQENEGKKSRLSAPTESLGPTFRDVCVKEDPVTGRCSPVFCDDNSEAIWSGRIIREQQHRGKKMVTAGSARAGSGCAVSDEYKFIYIHVLKSGGITFKGSLREGMCDDGRFDDKLKQCEHKAGGPKRLTVQNCASAVMEHPDYTTFSFVRNPFSRWFSAWAMGNEYSRSGKGDTFPLSFDSFVKNPRSMGTYSKVSSAHWSPQTSFLFDTNGCPVVDFIGHLEFLDADFERVMDLIGRPSQMSAYLLQNGGLRRAKSTAYGDRAKADRASIFNSENMAAIRSLSAEEFKLFGYDPGLPPA